MIQCLNQEKQHTMSLISIIQICAPISISKVKDGCMRTLFDKKPMIGGVSKVAKKSFDCFPMMVLGIMHELACFVDIIR